MMPLSETQQQSHRQFKKFLFVILKPEMLEEAIKDQHPEMTDATLSFIRGDINELQSFISPS